MSTAQELVVRRGIYPYAAAPKRQQEHGSPGDSGQGSYRQLNNGNIRNFNRHQPNNELRASYPDDYRRIRSLARHPDLVDTEMGIYANDPAFAKYAACIADPWEAEPARVPTGSQLPSQVYKSTITVNVTTSAINGFGYIAVCPTTANDKIAAIYSSSATTVVTQVPAQTSTPTGYGIAGFTTLPYSGFQHNAFSAPGDQTAVKSRVVACSMRVEPTTAMLNRGGLIRVGQSQGQTAAGVDFQQQQDLIVGNAHEYDGGLDGMTELRWQTASICDLDFNDWFQSGSNSVTRTQPFSQCAGGSINIEVAPMYAIFQAPMVGAGYSNQTYTVRICIVAEYTGFVAAGVPISSANPRRALPSLPDIRGAMVKVLNKASGKKKGDWFDTIFGSSTAKHADNTLDYVLGKMEKLSNIAGNVLLGRRAGAQKLIKPKRKPRSTVTIEEIFDQPKQLRIRN